MNDEWNTLVEYWANEEAHDLTCFSSMLVQKYYEFCLTHILMVPVEISRGNKANIS